jgi:hypothetical protein
MPYGGPNIPCANGVEVLIQNLVLDRTSIVFSATTGPTKEIRHVSFTGRLASASTGKSLPYRGHFTRTEDFVTGIVTTAGLTRQTTVPGTGTIALAAGREVVAPSADDASIAGNNTLGGYNQDVCELLS